MAQRLGIVGGGQLGRMLALAAAPLGIECRFIDPAGDAGAGVAADQIVAEYSDAEALRELAQWSDVVTFEFENVPADALELISGLTTLAPSPRSLEVSQDRLKEKQLFESLGLQIGPYAAVDSRDQLESALATIGAPAILKTRKLGYDGKGQARIDGVGDAKAAWSSVAEAPCLLEGFVEFDHELSAVVVRSSLGTAMAYPPAENVHQSGILHRSHAPAPNVSQALCDEAVSGALSIAEDLDHIGVLAVEFFVAGERLLVNELAPRVHNSGHWTQDGAGTSQFENHLRAVFGMPLGAAAPITETVMINLIGDIPDHGELLAVAGTHLHDYDKQPREGRKLGHVNVVDFAGRQPTLIERSAEVEALAEAVRR